MGQFRAATDENGIAELLNVAPGPYMLRVEHDTFIPPTYGASGTVSTPLLKSITVGSSPQVQDFAISLMPGAIIRGRIRDASGAAVSGARVSIGVLTYRNGLPNFYAGSGADTNAQGEYLLRKMAPGEYFLRLEIPGTRGAFFPNAEDFKTASAILIHGGEELLGIDIDLPKRAMLKVSGILVNSPPSVPIRFSFVANDEANPDAFDGTSLTNARSGAHGEFEFQLPPGNWDVFATGKLPELPSTVTTSSITGHVRLRVADSDIQSVVIEMNTIDIPGRIIAPDSSPESALALFESLRLMLSPRDHNYGVSRTNIETSPSGGSSATFTLRSVPPGKYNLTFGSTMPAGFYVSDIRQGNQSIYTDDLITIERPPVEPIEIVVRPTHALLTGTVQNMASRSEADVSTVALVPAPELRRNPLLFQVAPISPDGTFAFHDVPPGNYKLFAWKNVVKGAEQSAEFLSKYEYAGVPVTITESGSFQVQLKFIP